jgi:molecular chaperone DnaK (HSP70)
MKVLIALILSICFRDVLSQHSNTKSSIDSCIYWQENRRLAFEDFKGSQDTTFLVYGYPANGAASTKIETTFLVDENGRITVIVLNKFLKEKSWIMNRKPSVLSHEQGHFDISEIYARKIRKAVNELLRKNIDDENIYKETIKLFLNELAIHQEKYDAETHHGFLFDKQSACENKIQKELNELKMFQ